MCNRIKYYIFTYIRVYDVHCPHAVIWKGTSFIEDTKKFTQIKIKTKTRSFTWTNGVADSRIKYCIIFLKLTWEWDWYHKSKVLINIFSSWIESRFHTYVIYIWKNFTPLWTATNWWHSRLWVIRILLNNHNSPYQYQVNYWMSTNILTWTILGEVNYVCGFVNSAKCTN